MASIVFENVSVDIPVFNATNRSLKNNIISAATGGQISPRDTKRMSVRRSTACRSIWNTARASASSATTARENPRSCA